MVFSVCVSVVASIGTSYARYTYTGENQIVLYTTPEELQITSNILMPQGCTVVMKDWNLDDNYSEQTIEGVITASEKKGKLGFVIPEEIQKYFTFTIADKDGKELMPGEVISVDGDTVVKLTVTPVKSELKKIVEKTQLRVSVTFTEVIESLNEDDGTVTTYTGQTLTGLLKWNVIPSENPIIVDLPATTVTELDVEDLTFALNFKAGAVTEEQLEYYGSWYTDFEITINKDVTLNDDGTADGHMAGRLSDYSPKWFKIPEGESLTIAADTPFKIMKYAGVIIGQPDHDYTYKEVYEGLKNFDCGIYFDEEFIAANPDLEVKLELRMYNPEDPSESYVIGETYIFTLPAPEVPVAKATELKVEDLTFAMNFKAGATTAEQLEYYGNWYTDFEITINKDVTLNDNGTADGYMSGRLSDYSPKWFKIPEGESLTIAADTPFKIMKYAGVIIGQPDHDYTYKEVYEGLKNFDCGIYFDEEFIAANPDLEVKLELRMYNPEDPSESYVLGDTHIFRLEIPEKPTASVTEIDNSDLTFALNFKAGATTAEQLEYYGSWLTDFEITLNKNVTLKDDGTADGYMSGRLSDYSPKWFKIPEGESLTIAANTPFKIMKYAGVIIGQPNHDYTYKEVYEGLKNFDCGIYFDEEFIAANPDFEVKLELRMYNPANPSESYILGDVYRFTAEDIPEVEPEPAPTPTRTPTPEPVICEKCGETGHTAENCTVPDNLPGGSTGDVEEEEGEWSLRPTTMDIAPLIKPLGLLDGAVVSPTPTPETTPAPQETPVPEVTPTPAPENTPQPTPTPEGTPAPDVAAATNISIAETGKIKTYTHINYPRGTERVKITSREGFAPYTQVHTEDEIYILPYGGGMTVETSALRRGTLDYCIINQYKPDEKLPEYADISVVWYFEDGKTKNGEQQTRCATLTDTDFANVSPLTEFFSATKQLNFKVLATAYTPETIAEGCNVEYYSNGKFVPLEKDIFSVKLNGDKVYLTSGDKYPPAGVYRFCFQLLPGNPVSTQYKTFFVNYR